MSEPTDKNRERASAKSPAKGKRPYQKPAVRHEGVFETMALACGKLSSTQAQCKTNTKNS